MSGALYLRGGRELSSIVFGEVREMAVWPGPENVPACVGMGVAANLVSRCIDEVEANFCELRERFINGLNSSVNGVVFLGSEEAGVLPNTLCVELRLPLHRGERPGNWLCGLPSQGLRLTKWPACWRRSVGRRDRSTGRCRFRWGGPRAASRWIGSLTCWPKLVIPRIFDLKG